MKIRDLPYLTTVPERPIFPGQMENSESAGAHLTGVLSSACWYRNLFISLVHIKPM